jgi:hypothetical protein
MEILMGLMLYLGPVAVAYCIYRALRETKA